MKKNPPESQQIVTTPRRGLPLAVIVTDSNVLAMDQLVDQLCVISCNSGKVLRLMKARGGKKSAVKELKSLVRALVEATGRAQIVLHEATKTEEPAIALRLTNGSPRRLRLGNTPEPTQRSQPLLAGHS